MRSRSASARLLVAALGAAILIGPLRLPRVAAQSTAHDWEEAAGGKMSFDVASVKRGNPGMAPSTNSPLGLKYAFRPTDGVFSVKNRYLTRLIGRAKDNPMKDQFRLMVQSLLAERFKLALCFKQRQVAASGPNRIVILDRIEQHAPSPPARLKRYGCANPQVLSSPLVV